MMRLPPRKQEANGFTLVEAMITVVIVGILSSIALPNYFNQVQRTKQNEAASTLAQFQTTVASYFDEFNLTPASWADLNNVAVIMTNGGPASARNGALTTQITLPGNEYSVSRTNVANNYYEFTAFLVGSRLYYFATFRYGSWGGYFSSSHCFKSSWKKFVECSLCSTM